MKCQEMRGLSPEEMERQKKTLDLKMHRDTALNDADARAWLAICGAVLREHKKCRQCDNTAFEECLCEECLWMRANTEDRARKRKYMICGDTA